MGKITAICIKIVHMPENWTKERLVAIGIPLGGLLIGGASAWLLTRDLSRTLAGGILGLGLGVLLAITELRKGTLPAPRPRGDGAGIQGLVAGALIVAYMLGLAGAWWRAHATGSIQDGSAEKEWLEVFKTGYTLLGGALTTVVGYFFGNRNADKVSSAIDKADRITEDAKQTADLAIGRLESAAAQGSTAPTQTSTLSEIAPKPEG